MQQQQLQPQICSLNCKLHCKHSQICNYFTTFQLSAVLLGHLLKDKPEKFQYLPDQTDRAHRAHRADQTVRRQVKPSQAVLSQRHRLPDRQTVSRFVAHGPLGIATSRLVGLACTRFFLHQPTLTLADQPEHSPPQPEASPRSKV